jgi:uncharacterized protein
MRQVLTFIVPLFVAICCACEVTKSTGQEVEREHRIMDEAELLTDPQEDTIFSLIKDLEKDIGSQIAVLTIVSLNGEKIEEFSLKTANKIGVGRAEYDDGILITVAVADKQLRIEVGLGLEKIIRDEIASRIVREIIAPQFKEGDYFNGIKQGVETIKKLIEENKQLIGERP